MKNKNKLLTLLTLSSTAVAVTAIMNKLIKFSATSKDILSHTDSCCFKWRFGNIHYTKSGSGRPVLLVHNLSAESSSFEYIKLVSLLKEQFTVYSIDLLGCGKSEKPCLTYTNYLYVQLLSDFIKSEIGHRTDIIASCNAAPLAIMACSNSPELFNNIILINPSSIASTVQIPGKYSKIFKWMLDLPVLGTLIYNIGHTKKLMKEELTNHLFSNPYSVTSAYVDAYYESAHLGNSPKSIYASVMCKYTQANIGNALKKIDNSIYLIGGSDVEDNVSIFDDYKLYNPAIECVTISNSKMLPHLENPVDFYETVQLYFS